MTFLTMAEVADMLKVSVATVSRWCAQDASFPATRLPGRLVRIEAAAFDRWLRARGRTQGQRESPPPLVSASDAASGALSLSVVKRRAS